MRVKVTKDELIEAGLVLAYHGKWPDFIELEATPLEDTSTVEKCCNECRASYWKGGMECYKPTCKCHFCRDCGSFDGKHNKLCHSKKEEIIYRGSTCYCKKDFVCKKHRETPKVPEIIGWYNPKKVDFILVMKLNEVISYLKAHES